MIFLVLRSVRTAVCPAQVTVGVARVLCWLLEVAVRVRRMQPTTTVPLHPARSSSNHLLLLLLQGPVDLHGEVVDPGPGQSPDMTGDDWDDPPVVVLSEDPGTPASHQGEHTRPQVPGRVDSVATVVAQTEPDTEDGDADTHRDHLFVQLHIAGVRDGADTQQEQESSQELIEDSPRGGEMRRRIGGEYPCRLWDGPVHRPVVLVPHQGVPVDQEHQAGGCQSSQVLGSQVVRDLIVTIVNRRLL